MKLQQRTVRWIVGLTVGSLAGLVVLQLILLRNAFELKEQAFRQNVLATMNSIAQKLQTAEAVGDVFRIAVETSGTPSVKRMTVYHVDADTGVVRSGQADSLVAVAKVLPVEFPPPKYPLRVEGPQISYSVPRREHVTLRVHDIAGQCDTVLVNDVREKGEYLLLITPTPCGGKDLIYKLSTDSLTYTTHVINGVNKGVLESISGTRDREAMVGRVLENLTIPDREPIHRRIDQALLDSVVGSSLRESGISLECAYAVAADPNDSLCLMQPAGYAEELHSSTLRSRLFPADFLFNKNQLVLYFPGQRLYLLRQVGPMLLATVALVGVIIFCLWFTIRTMVRQKQFAIRLVDFINNMTHEFKTPISTISVATETIIRPDVIEQKEKLLRYANVIQEENHRMKTQVDKILQMAVLEEGDFELKKTPLDIHDVIRRAVENIALQVEAKHGSVTYDLAAGDSIVNADPVHLSNVVYNILDNANKYSPEEPAIRVETRNLDGRIQIRISDRGIGISAEDAGRVFDKYYRVHTGNLHDVKGFGLGLSYVKMMMAAHGGDVSLQSSPGTGTTVTLALPASRHIHLSP